jgi:hypothetical protein
VSRARRRQGHADTKVCRRGQRGRARAGEGAGGMYNTHEGGRPQTRHAGRLGAVEGAAEALPRRPVVDCHGSRPSVCARRACGGRAGEGEALAPAL